MSRLRVFVDTSYVQALYHRRDRYHDQARLWSRRLRDAETWITESVLVEIGMRFAH